MRRRAKLKLSSPLIVPPDNEGRQWRKQQQATREWERHVPSGRTLPMMMTDTPADGNAARPDAHDDRCLDAVERAASLLASLPLPNITAHRWVASASAHEPEHNHCEQFGSIPKREGDSNNRVDVALARDCDLLMDLQRETLRRTTPQIPSCALTSKSSAKATDEGREIGWGGALKPVTSPRLPPRIAINERPRAFPREL
jgi:hypothetical protein